MLAIKASFRSKTVLLGKGLASLQDLEKQLQARFPGEIQGRVIFKLDGHLVQDFEQVQKIAEEKGVNSIKLYVFSKQDLGQRELTGSQPGSSSIQGSQEQGFDLAIDSGSFVFQTETIQIGSQELEMSTNLPKIIRPGQTAETISSALKCQKQSSQGTTSKETQTIEAEETVSQPNQGLKVKGEESPPKQEVSQPKPSAQSETGCQHECLCQALSQGCEVYNCTGQLDTNSSLVRLIQKIASEKVEKILQGYQLVPKAKQQVVESLPAYTIPSRNQPQCDKPTGQPQISKDVATLDNIKIDVEDSEDNHQWAIAGQPFYWKFVVMTQSVPEGLEANIIDETTYRTMQIKLGHKQTVTVGPFQTNGQKIIGHTFRHFYYDSGSQMKFFGPRFGFNVEVINRPGQNPMKLTNQFRACIGNIRKSLGKNKNIEYILERLKEMGISEDNFRGNTGVIYDTIGTL